MWKTLLLALCLSNILLLSQEVNGQESDSREVIQSIIESMASNAEEDLDQNQVILWFDQLAFYYEHPISLNHADADALAELPVWNERQIHAFLRYRDALGPLISLHELQAVPGLPLESIQRLRPFVTVNEEEEKYQVQIGDMLTKGSNEISFRWQRTLELARGYLGRDDSLPPAFIGDPNRYYMRFRHSYSNRLSYGLVLEKDPGEAVGFDGQPGADFASIHLYARDLNSWLHHAALGDYSISLGQGLIQHSGFGRGKNSFITAIKKGGRVIRPSASVNEIDFFRGGACSISILDQWEGTLFASHRRVDGNIAQEPIDTSGVFEYFTSLQETGLHRTSSEIADRNKVKHTVLGGRIRHTFDEGSISLNALYNAFSPALQRRKDLYNQYYFNGNSLLNISVDYSWIYENFHLFGEIAHSDNGGIAAIQGALVTLHPRVDLAVLFRTLGTKYQAIRPNPFAETSGARNETGLYAGTIVRFGTHWKFGLYADFWHHPWLRFNTDAPSNGREFLSRLDFRIKREMEVYLQYRFESKEQNASVEQAEDYLIPQTRQQLRFQFNREMDPFEIRNRLEWSFYKVDEMKENGFLILQDVIYKPLASPFSFTTRIAYFDTDSYSSRIYAYENDLIYTFSIPPYYRKGVRYYLNLRYKGIRNLTLEARYARTSLLNDESFGSGYDEIDSRHDSEVKLQMIYRW